jgi:hypothetical protein
VIVAIDMSLNKIFIFLRTPNAVKTVSAAFVLFYLCVVCILMLCVAHGVIVYSGGCRRKWPWPNLRSWISFYHKGFGKTSEIPGQYDLSVG